MGLRLGIPLLIAWAIAFALAGWIPKAVAGAATLVAGGHRDLGAALRHQVAQGRPDRPGAPTRPRARKEALEKLETDFKKDDTAAIFAKAQLQLQEDPRAALKTLETINLEKVMAPIADEARTQRAMIHLMLGETDEARALADKVDMARHKEPRTRATHGRDRRRGLGPQRPGQEGRRPARDLRSRGRGLRGPQAAAPPRARLRLRLGERHQADARHACGGSPPSTRSS